MAVIPAGSSALTNAARERTHNQGLLPENAQQSNEEVPVLQSLGFAFDGIELKNVVLHEE
jgi:hypothetical protein